MTDIKRAHIEPARNMTDTKRTHIETARNMTDIKRAYSSALNVNYRHECVRY